MTPNKADRMESRRVEQCHSHSRVRRAEGLEGVGCQLLTEHQLGTAPAQVKRRGMVFPSRMSTHQHDKLALPAGSLMRGQAKPTRSGGCSG